MLDKFFACGYTCRTKLIFAMSDDLYGILGIKKDADNAAIKSAYRKLAIQWHPDKHKGDKTAEDKFKKINAAYEILSDKSKRQQYDTFGAQGPAGQGFQGGFGGFGSQGFDFSGFGGNGASGFADIFETFFGAGGGGGGHKRRGGPVRGNDIEAHIKITFKDAVFGVEKELEITKPDTCKNCKGDGAEPGSKMVQCGSCGGSGEIRAVRNTLLGQMTTSRVCDECEGEGQTPDKKCSVCHGTTRVRVKERVKVKIPAGVDDGSVIRLAGKGEGGVKGGESGDLYINLMVEADKRFLRHGSDIHTILGIHLLQAVLGAEIEIETIHGPEKIKVPAGTEDAKVFKLSGKGVKKLNSERNGDHLIKIKIDIPKKLSKKEKELYAELAETGKVEVKKGGLFS